MSAEPLLRLEEVGRSFGPPTVHALAGVTLDVHPGAALAITGRSGSGKSTLLNILGLLERPTAGRYLVAGRDVAGLRPAELNRLRADTFGFVFQAFHLVPYLSVTENVELALTYARSRSARRGVGALIARVGLGHRRDAHVRTLSGGEQQRVAIARALVRRPRVLFADEPTGNLDDASAEAVLALFEEIRADGVAIVMVTHDEATAARAGQRLHLRDGRPRP